VRDKQLKGIHPFSSSRVSVHTHRVDVYEEAMLLLVGMKTQHIVQQHRVSVKEVRMRDEDRRV